MKDQMKRGILCPPAPAKARVQIRIHTQYRHHERRAAGEQPQNVSGSPPRCPAACGGRMVRKSERHRKGRAGTHIDPVQVRNSFGEVLDMIGSGVEDHRMGGKGGTNEAHIGLVELQVHTSMAQNVENDNLPLRTAVTLIGRRKRSRSCETRCQGRHSLLELVNYLTLSLEAQNDRARQEWPQRLITMIISKMPTLSDSYKTIARLYHTSNGFIRWSD